MTKDLVAFPVGNSIVYSFVYSPDHFNVTAASIHDTIITQQEYNNGNIASEMDIVYGPFVGEFSVSLYVTYNNHPNPFFIQVSSVCCTTGLKIFLKKTSFLHPKNNPVEYTNIVTGSPPKNFHYQYNYSMTPTVTLPV